MIDRRRFLGGAGASLAALAMPTFAGCRRHRGDELVLGAILGLSGEDSSLGSETREGMDIAIEEINAAGGFKGKRVRVLYEDTRLDPTLANEKIQKLIDRDDVPCVIGDAGSTATLGAAVYAERAKVPLVSPSATAVEVTRHKKYVFRVCFTDDKQGLAAAKFAREDLKADRAAVLYVTGNKYSEGLQAIFAHEFEKRGGKIVAKETFQTGETNVLTFLQKIKDANPQVVFAPVYPSDVAKIGPKKKEIGLEAPLLGTDGWDGPATRAKGVIESIEGCYFTNLYAADGPIEGAKPFIEKFKQKSGGALPSALSAGGYDALRLVLDAIARAGSENPEAIRNALANTKGYHGVTGTFDIDANHDAQKPVTVMKITDGDFRYHSLITV